jgi:hypothetical protein
MEWIDWEAKGLTEDDLRHLHGRNVLSADHQKLGTIHQVWNPMMEVNSTTLGVKTDAQELWVPLFAVQEIAKDHVTLTTTKDQLKEHDWTTPPPGWVGSVDEPHHSLF